MDANDDGAIAELNDYGLPMRVVNALEDKLEIIWIKELRTVRPEQITSIPNLGDVALRQLQQALRAYVAAKGGTD